MVAPDVPRTLLRDDGLDAAVSVLRTALQSNLLPALDPSATLPGTGTVAAAAAAAAAAPVSSSGGGGGDAERESGTEDEPGEKAKKGKARAGATGIEARRKYACSGYLLSVGC
jgi:hypothetical protein